MPDDGLIDFEIIDGPEPPESESLDEEKKSWDDLPLITDAALASKYAASGHIGIDYAMRVNTFFACVNLIRQDISKLPIRMTQTDENGRDHPVRKHPLIKFFKRNPNRFQNILTYKSCVILSLLLRGNAYIFKRYDSRGALTDLIPWHPDLVQILESPEDGRLYYQFTTQGQFHRFLLGSTQQPVSSITVSSDYVLHMVGMTLDGIRGVSALEYGAQTLRMAYDSETYGSTLFSNSSRPSGVLLHPGRKMTEEAKTNLRASWERMYSGAKNAHRTAILMEGMKFEPISMTSADAQFLETRKFSVEDIARLMRVYPHKVGHLERMTFNNTESLEASHVNDTLMPWMELIESAYEYNLLSRNELDINIKHDVAYLLRGQLKDRHDTYAKGRQWGYYSANDVRGFEGLPPVPGGDIYERPLNMVPMDQEAKPPEEPPPDIVDNEESNNA